MKSSHTPILLDQPCLVASKDESPDLGRSPFFSGLALRCRELEQALNALDDTSRAAVHTLRFMQETFA